MKRRHGKRRSQEHSGVVIHYDDLPAKDITQVDGIPVTTPVRTIIDIAPDLEDDNLRRVVLDAADRRLLTLEELALRLSDADMLHRPGTRRLRRLLTEL